MTHEGERTYHDRVVAFLKEQYGESNVSTDVYLPDPYRFADVIVDGPVVTLAVEIENDFEAAISGVGQAVIYAGERENAIPVVVLPPDHVDHPEIESLRRVVPVVELDV